MSETGLDTLSEALRQVEEVCGSSASISQSTSREELREIVWDSITLVGEWPDLRPFIPRFLQLFAGELMGSDEQWDEADMLFYKLLLCSRPDLRNQKHLWHGGDSEPVFMDSQERRAIFRFVTSVLHKRLIRQACNEFPYSFSVPDVVAFLAAFDSPIAEFVRNWQESSERLERANLCAFLAHFTLHDTPRQPVLRNIYATRMTILPENLQTLDALLAPSAVASYILTHISDWEILDEKSRFQIETAYDWSARAAKML